MIEIGGTDYLCLPSSDECMRYPGGPPPSFLGQPDLWCPDLGSCTTYDPDEWFALTDTNLVDYLCEERPVGRFLQWDCYRSLTDTPPSVTLSPDLYCSGNQSFPDCSPLWYPDELSGLEIVTFDGQTFVCDRALFGGFSDYDCSRYSGGNPGLVFGTDLKCSDTGFGLECDYFDYPSILNSVYFATIDGFQVVCEDVIGGSDCYRYYGGSISDALIGIPDYYCNPSGECDRFSRPW